MGQEATVVVDVNPASEGHADEFTFDTYEEQLRQEFGSFEPTEYSYPKIG